MSRNHRTLIFGGLVLATLVGSSFAFAPFRVLDRKKVYYGTPDAFNSPAVVESAKVMAKLPAAVRIESENVKKDSARWFVLMNEANQQFKKALAGVAKSGGYDLIAEVGSIAGPATVNDATDKVIAAGTKD